MSFLRPQLTQRDRRRNLIALSIALLVAVAGSVLQAQQAEALRPGGPVYALDSNIQDFMLSFRDPTAFGLTRDPREFITIIAMDEKSIAELGVFRSWPRTYHAQVLDTMLATTPPRAVVWDVGFFEESPEDPEFVAALERARTRVPPVRVVLPTVGISLATNFDAADVRVSNVLHVLPELAALTDVASANVVPDNLGTVRAMPLLVDLEGTELPTLGLAGASKYLRRPTYVDSRPDPNTFVVSGREVPVNRFGMMKINYFGPPSTPNQPSTFRVVSFVDVLRGRVDPAIWRDGLVFIGLHYATGFADDYWTPVSQNTRKMDGVEIHASAAATFFSTQFLREVPVTTQVGVIFLLALAIGAVTANLGVPIAGSIMFVTLAAYAATAFLSLVVLGLQLPVAAPLVAGGLTFGSITAYRVMVEQRQARALQGALASVIPPVVALEIAKDPDRVKMGGERRVISVLFTDLMGFTSFSETISPELLSRVITEYLDAMTAVIFRRGGTVDKFIGDAVMAFWNAPLDDPDHARHACEAALEMQATLRKLGDKWEAEGLPRQYMRIGINTGPVSVGNMGTSQRFAYTALGDSVNLGARLEPLNNEYGTWICISQATLDAAGGPDRFLVRFLDMVAVKGKKEPVPVYELIGLRDDAELVQRYEPVLKPYFSAMDLYRAQKFTDALPLFKVAMTATGNGVDKPSAVYVERCEDLAETPPEPDWDGVYVMHHK